MKRIVTITFFVVVVISFIFFLKRMNDKTAYSFFVAGHIYGSPMGNSLHIHSPFEEAFPYIRSQRGMTFGIFTGDLVRKSKKENFDTLVSELSELSMQYYIAPGNHDVGDRNLYESYFFDKKQGRTYFVFTHENDLFILLDGNLNKWSISGEQLDFLYKTLDKFASKSRNVFVFVHQLIWWSDKNEFRNVKLNWPPYTPDSTNYWTEVEPLLASTGKPVYIFAGDLGANHIATPFMYFKKGNIAYIASGMGHGIDDNFVIVQVDENGTVNLELIALQGEKNRLGKLEDYTLPIK
jgi:hypothetical protein